MKLFVFVMTLFLNPIASAAEYKVTTQGWVFTPEVLTIQVGDKVIWVNDDDAIHNLVFENPQIQGIDKIKPEKEFSITFTQVGEFSYFCKPHQGNGMKGKIIVKKK